MSDGDLLLKIILLVNTVAGAVTAVAVLTGRGQKREITPQPLDVRATHECVKRPEMVEMWEVVNGIRRAVGKIEASTATSEALRKENGIRLGKVEEKLSDVSDTLHEQAGAMHEFAKRIK